MSSGNGPFGKYAAIVAAVVALSIVGAWLAATGGVIPSSDTLNAAFWTVVGATIGTGVGATTVANGLSKQTEAAHTRLDAIKAPSEQVATRIVEQREGIVTVRDANS